MDNITLQHYIDMYRQPLSEESLEAISKLSEIVVEKKKMKKVKKNNKAPALGDSSILDSVALDKKKKADAAKKKNKKSARKPSSVAVGEKA
jgi:hypothetical protein